jgi:SLT domain-containing protein
MVRAGAVDHLRGALPGFASGGLVGGGSLAGAQDAVARYGGTDAAALARVDINALVKAVKAAIAAKAAAAFSASKVPNVGSGVARWKGTVDQALRMEGLSTAFDSRVLYQMQTESGGNPNAINLTDINAQRGDPSRGLMQVIGSTFRAYHWPGTSNNIYDPLANIAAAINYARHTYGPQLGNQYGGIGSGHGYALGGLIPGFASGGVAGQGAAYLKAWQTKHGGGYGAAWGPVVVNQQIAAMTAAAARAKALAGAKGLSSGQHKFWAGTAADETRRLGVLNKELTTERAWRSQLGLNELGLDKEIRAAGNLKSLAGPVKGWKAQLGRDKATVAAISKMLGYSNAYLAAHPAAKPGPVLPKITHTYGGDVANNLGAVLATALGPFTGAARGGMVMDQGGTLRPGFNPVWNKTGRPEQLVPARSGGGGKLQVEWVGGNGGGDLERWIRKNVRVRGGTGPGAVERAYGSR